MNKRTGQLKGRGVFNGAGGKKNYPALYKTLIAAVIL